MAHARAVHLDETFARPELVWLLDGVVVTDLNRGSRLGDNGGDLNLWDRHREVSKSVSERVMEKRGARPCFICVLSSHSMEPPEGPMSCAQIDIRQWIADLDRASQTVAA